MKTIFAFILTLVSTFAFAEISSHDVNRAGFDKLSETEKAAIIQQVAQKSSVTSSIIDDITPEKIDRFVQVGSIMSF